MTTSTTPPLLTPLPPAPLPTDAEAVFDAKAGASLTAQAVMVGEVNTALAWQADSMAASLVYKDAAAGSAAAAASSATAADGAVVSAQAQVGLAAEQVNNAAASASSALVSAAAAQAAAGTPSLTGNKNKVLTVKADETGVLWRAVGQQIGDLMLSLNPPGAEYKLADGATYLQASYPEYIAKVGLVPVSPPSALDQAWPAFTTTGTKYSMVGDSLGVYYVVDVAENQTGQAYARLEPYKRVNGVITKLPIITTTNQGAPAYMAMSGDGVYLAVTYGGGASPYLEVFKRTGDTFAKLNMPAITQGGQGVAFSDDGVYLGVVLNSSPYFAVYKRSGDTFARLATPVVGSTALVKMSVSADGVYWIMTTNSSNPNLALVKRTGDTFTMLATPVYGGITFNDVSMSKDGNYFVANYSSGVSSYVFKRNGDSFSFLTTANNAGGANAIQSILSPDGKYLFSADTNGLFAFRNVSDKYVALSVAGAGTGLSMIVGHFDTAYLNSYIAVLNGGSTAIFGVKDAYPFNPNTEFQVPMAAASNGTPASANTAASTLYSIIKTYVKMKEPA